MTSPARCQERLSSRIPLFGSLFRDRFLQRLEDAAGRGDPGAVRTLAGIAQGSPEGRSKAVDVLSHLASPEAIDVFCAFLLAHDDPVLMAIAERNGYLPKDEGKRAVYLFLTGRDEEYARLDPGPGHSLLVRGYLASPEPVRMRILGSARRRGLNELIPVLGRDQPEMPVRSCREWQVQIDLLSEEQRWNELFRLIFSLPLPTSVETIHRLAAAGWESPECDRILWNDLRAFAPDSWSAPEPGDPQADTLQSSAGLVAKMSVSPDGGLLACGIHDGSIHIWKIPEGSLLHSLERGRTGITALEFSPDGDILAAGDADGTLRLFDPLEGRLKATISAHQGLVRSIIYHGLDGSLVSAGADGSLRCHNPSTCGLRWGREAHTGPITCLAGSGGRIATGGEDCLVRVWEEDGLRSSDLRGHRSPPFFLVFGGDGRFLASGGGQGFIRVWCLPEGTLARTIDPGDSPIVAWSASPDGSLLALGGQDGRIRVLSLPGGEELAEFQVHGGGIACVALSPDKTLLSAGSRDGMLQIWSVMEKRLVKRRKVHRDCVRHISFPGSAGAIMSSGWDGTVCLRRIPECIPVCTMKCRSPGIHALAATPDGRILVSGGEDGGIRVWDPGAGGLRMIVDAYTNCILSLALDPAGCLAACAGRDGSLSVWDLKNGSLRATLTGHRGTLHAIAISPDGTLLAAGGWDESVRIWSLPDGTLKATFRGHRSLVTSLAFTPDGGSLVSGSNDRTIRVWDIPSGSPGIVLDGHSHIVSCLGISTDGRLLASGSWDRTVRTWSLPDGESLQVLKGEPEGRITCLSLHPDGSLLCLGSDNGGIRFWTLPDGLPVRTRARHPGPLTSACLLPLHHLLATASHDGSLKTWRLPWTRPLCKTTPGDLSFVRAQIPPGPHMHNARNWLFLERLLSGRFRNWVECCGSGLPAGPYEIEMVEEPLYADHGGRYG